MLKRLRLKIIFILIFSFLFVTGALVLTINLIAHQQMLKSAHQVLLMLSENDGMFPSEYEIENPDVNVNITNNSDEDEDSETGDNQNIKIHMNYDLGFGENITVETPYNTRYFSVDIDTEDNVISYDLSHIAAISKDDLQDLVTRVLNKKKDEGNIGNYRYLRVDEDYGMSIYFVDCYARNIFTSYIMRMSIYVAGICMIFVSIVVYLLSARAIKPMEENIKRQKQFFTDASHELKTPVAAISANVDVLELVSGETEITGKIRKQTKQLSTLINEMLTLTRIDDANVLPEEKEKIDMSNMVNQQLSDIEARVQVENKKLINNVSSDICINAVRKDIDRLVSVLLDNAVKYCEEDGEIRVKLSRDRKNVCFYVYNTCEAIDEDDRLHLFDRFYRGDKARNRESGSYGIGLSIAKAIVDRHKGKIEVKNEDNGVLFEVHLPI